MWKGVYLGLPCTFITYEELINALKNEGVDNVYERLLKIYNTEPLFVIDDGKVMFKPWDEEELYRFLKITYTIYKDIEIEEE